MLGGQVLKRSIVDVLGELSCTYPSFCSNTFWHQIDSMVQKTCISIQPHLMGEQYATFHTNKHTHQHNPSNQYHK